MRSSMMRRCSAAVPSDGILNSSSTLGSSEPACSHPLRAMVQKSAALLVTKATLNLLPEPPPLEQPDTVKLTSATEQNTTRNTFMKSYLARQHLFQTILSQAVFGLACLSDR